jgi:DNA invertase Pin-like site-specific DNA recombinase
MRHDQGVSPFLSTIESHRLDVVRVAIYARQSKARPDASEASPEAQVAAGTALAASRSLGGVLWETSEARVFKDVGRSGWDPSVIRPGFEEMMKAVRAGEIDVVIVNELSRLTRKGAHDALEIDNEFKKYGVRFVSVLEPFLDTSNPIGVAIFALIAALAKQDSDIKAERLKGAKDQIAAVGGWHSSQPPFGMRTERVKMGPLTVSVLVPDDDNPTHVEIVERMIQMSWDGISDNKIATTFDAEDVIAPGEVAKRATEKRLASIKARRVSDSETAIRWRAQTVRWILNHPAIGGFAVERVKRGKAYENVIARDDSGKPLTPHTGITTGAKWLELQERRKARSRPDIRPGGEEVTPALLSGWRFLQCRVCAGSMGQTPGTVMRNGQVSSGGYSCANPKGHGGLMITREPLDEYVARRVWARLTNADMTNEEDREWVAAAALRFAAQRDLAGVAETQRETQSHLDHVRRSITELQADRKAGLYKGREELETWRATMLQYREFEEQCVARLAELSSQTAEATTVPAEWFNPNIDHPEDPIGKGSIWAGWDVYEQRKFLDLFLTGVAVGVGRDKETKKYIPIEERVRLDWRPLPDDDSEEASEEREAELAAM